LERWTACDVRGIGLPYSVPPRCCGSPVQHNSWHSSFAGWWADSLNFAGAVPTSSAEVSGSLVAAAKAAIHAGDQRGALALLDGLRTRPADQGRELPPVVAEALVATARGEMDSDRELLASRLREVHAALQQILTWLDALPFDTEDLAQVAVALSARRTAVEEDARVEQGRAREGAMAVRSLGSGWLEWRMVSKPSGREFGPYVYYRWREGGRKRTKYVGRAAVRP
jgi:hypothetical protein